MSDEIGSTESPKPGWYLLLNPDDDQCDNKFMCARFPNESYLLNAGWTLGPAIDDLLRDTERYRWLLSNFG